MCYCTLQQPIDKCFVLYLIIFRADSNTKPQIIGMSATLPNLHLLAKWLDASLYCTDYRPVPLSENIKVDTRIFDQSLVECGRVPEHLVAPDDADHIIALCLETVLGGHSVLMFCPTKNWCEKVCEMVARRFYTLGHQQCGNMQKEGKYRFGGWLIVGTR